MPEDSDDQFNDDEWPSVLDGSFSPSDSKAPPADEGADDLELTEAAPGPQEQGLDRTFVYESQEGPIDYSVNIEDLEGKVLLNTFHIEKELGKGAQGKVFLAWDEGRGKYVAVKFLSEASDDLIRRFKAEAKNMSAAGGYNVARADLFSNWQGIPFLVLETMDHELDDRLKKERWFDPNDPRRSFWNRMKLAATDVEASAPFKEKATTVSSNLWQELKSSTRKAYRFFHLPNRLPLEDTTFGVEYAVELVRSLASGLQELHDEGVFHRDIKPANIMFRPYAKPTRRGEFGFPEEMSEEEKWQQRRVLYNDLHKMVALTDVGLAKARDTHEEFGEQEDKYILGTPITMAPEQAQVRNDDVNATSDVYALGVVLYKMLTGMYPVTGKTLDELIIPKRFEEEYRVIPPMQLNPDVCQDLNDVVMKALNFHQKDRHQSAAELEQDLVNVQYNYPISTNKHPGERMTKFIHRNSPWVALAFAAMATIGGFWVSSKSRQWEAESRFNKVVSLYGQREGIASVSSMDELITKVKEAKIAAEAELEPYQVDRLSRILGDLNDDRSRLATNERNDEISNLIARVQRDYGNHTRTNPQASSASYEGFLAELAPLISRKDLTDMRGQRLLTSAQQLDQKVRQSQGRAQRRERFEALEGTAVTDYNQVLSTLKATYHIEATPSGVGLDESSVGRIESSNITNYISEANSFITRLENAEAQMKSLVDNAERDTDEYRRSLQRYQTLQAALRDMRLRKEFASGLQRNHQRAQTILGEARQQEQEGQYKEALASTLRAYALALPGQRQALETRINGLFEQDKLREQGRAIDATNVVVSQADGLYELFLDHRRGVYDVEEVRQQLQVRRRRLEQRLDTPPEAFRGVTLPTNIRSSLLQAYGGVVASARARADLLFRSPDIVAASRQNAMDQSLKRQLESLNQDLLAERIDIPTYTRRVNEALGTYQQSSNGREK